MRRYHQLRSPRLVGTGAALLLLCGTVAACDATDPYKREGMWQPVGANSLNLAAMVARPGDLIRGRGANGTAGALAAAPVASLYSGKLTPLPYTGSQQASTGSAAQAPVAPGAAN